MFIFLDFFSSIAQKDECGLHHCPLCPYASPISTNVRVHLRIHTGLKSHTCKICGKSFSQKAHLITHMRLHSGERPFKCDLCTKSFTQKVHLQRHYFRCSRNHHDVHLQWIPSHVDIFGNEQADRLAKEGCSHLTSSSSALTFSEYQSKIKSHLSKKWRIPPSHHWYAAKEPGSSLVHVGDRASQTAISRLASGHTNSLSYFKGRKTYAVCSKCEAQQASAEHILDCLGLSKEDLYASPLLVIDFLRIKGSTTYWILSDLVRQLEDKQQQHISDRSLFNVTFTVRDIIEQEFALSCGNFNNYRKEGEFYICMFCAYSTPVIELKIMHFNIYISFTGTSAAKDLKKRALHFCPFCSYSSPLAGNLKIHINVHTKERQYSCGVCLKSFNNNSNLIRHNRIHTGEKPYTCDICNKRFNQSTSLRSHKLSHHNKNVLISC
ncbi:zinc finger protein 271-like [Parasteatoda tepidariorum]|uniref:zinc finger protein 271-like n=1 Tax=Parasteatoda tepidariorum TaxID=114398 RepID=UPI0039BC99CA